MDHPVVKAFNRSLSLRPFFLLFVAHVALLLIWQERSWLTFVLLPIILLVLFLFRRPLIFSLFLIITTLCMLPYFSPYDAQWPKQKQIDIVQGAPVQKKPDDHTYAVGRLADGRRLIVYGQAKQLIAGTLILTTAPVTTPEQQRNPGGFSEAHWAKSLAAKGVIRLQATDDITFHSGLLTNARRTIYEARRSVFQHLKTHLPKEVAWVAAFAGGGGGELDMLQRSRLSLLSLTHLTSVSGLHVGFLLLPLDNRQVKRRLTKRVRRSLIFFLMLWIIFLAGARTGVMRAILMRVVGMAASDRGYELGALEEGFAAGILILLMKGYAIYQIGFWLSLLAALGIRRFAAPLAEAIKRRLPFIPPPIAAAFSVTAVAQFFVLPLLILMNEVITPFALLANVLLSFAAQAMTLISLCLVSVLPLLTLFSAQGIVLSLLRYPVIFLIRVFEGVTSYRFPSWLYWLPGHASLFSWGFYLFLLYFLFRPLFGIRRKRKREKPLRLALWLLVFTITFVPYASRFFAPPMVIWQLDVGQGDAALIQFSDRTVWLIDGGDRGHGFRTIWPFMKAMGIASIDLAIVSHGHADHAGGIIDLVELGVIKTMAIGDETLKRALNMSETSDVDDSNISRFGDTDLSYHLLESAAKHNVPVMKLSSRDQMEHRAARLTVLPIDSLSDDQNDLSLQLYLEVGGVTFLYTADATAEVENELINLGLPAIDVLKVAHHGSRFTTKPAFVEHYRPTLAVISVGKNRYGHPSPDVLSTLDAYGVETYRTDQHGAIRLEPNEHEVKVKPWLNR